MSLKYYQEGGPEYWQNYSYINKFIRTANDISTTIRDNPDDEVVKIIKELDSYMKIYPEEEPNKYFFRGIGSGVIPIVLEYSSGILVNKSYSSCTYILDKAMEFTSDKCCILQFTIPHDIKYHKFIDQREGEILLERDTQFIIDTQNSTHPVYSAILTKYISPIIDNTSTEKELAEALANTLTQECTQIGKTQFYEKRMRYYLEDDDEIDDDEIDEDDAAFFASIDVKNYCGLTNISPT
jgi:hypothetical protein